MIVELDYCSLGRVWEKVRANLSPCRVCGTPVYVLAGKWWTCYCHTLMCPSCGPGYRCKTLKTTPRNAPKG